MNLFNFILVWVHLVAATFWVGGMMFLSLVVVPVVLNDSEPGSTQQRFVNLARRFRTLVWGALSLLIVTGTALLGNVVILSAPLSSWPPAVMVKLMLVFLLMVVSLAHDRIIGPKVRTLKTKVFSELSIGENLLLRLSPLLGRLSLVLGLGVLLAAVIMVRS